MLRRRALALFMSAASVTALAACGEGAGMTDMPEPEKEAKEAAPEPTAEPTAAPEATAEPTAAPEPTAEPTAAPQLDMPVLGQAPEIELSGWFNSEAITMESLKGKAAALVVFWTYT